MTTEQPKFGPEHFPAGTVIFRQGDPSTKFYIITSGSVAVIRRSPDGVQRVINQLGTGDFFGEIGMLQERRRMATLRAVTDVAVMAMDRDTFRNWLNSSDLIEAEITETIAQRIARDAAIPDEAMPEAQKVAEAGASERGEDAASPLLPSSTTAATKDSGPVTFAPGTVIVRQGEKAELFYIIVAGRVEITRETDGEERLLSYLESGDYFGEISLLESGTRTATVRALTEVKAVAFNREAFAKWMSDNPESESDIRQTARKRRRGTGN